MNAAADDLARLSLFADLTRPELEAVAQTYEEQLFRDGERILRQGLTGSGVYVILDGTASVTIDGGERARLGRGELFGEVSSLLGEPPVADVSAVESLRCLVIPAPRLGDFLDAYPPVGYRILQAQARRLRSANLWHG